MKIFNFLDGKRQMFVFGIIVVVLLTSGIGVVESRVALVEGDLEDMEEEALWESAQKKCKIYNEEPEFSQDEYLIYLKKVEEANPDADWKKIIAALHYAEFSVDKDRTLPFTPFPLFQHGDETLGYTDVDLVCRIGRTDIHNTPQFVYDKNCQKIDITHSYAGPRSDLGRGNGIGDLFGLWPWFMRRANTNWGDTWQGLTKKEGGTGWKIIDAPLRILGVSKVNWDPPDQYAGDYMGLWLSDYYRNPKNQNTPLSSAYKEYFDSQSGKWACNNEEVCKKAGYYWYDDQCYEEPEYKKEEECDVSHLNLCDNKYDCENVGRGYWYDDQCNMDPKNKCDFEHLNLCKNEKDCDYIGRYWYDNQCNENPEKDTSAGDNSGKEFTCPSPPKGAKHIVTNTADYWKMPDGKIVGQYQTWWDSVTAYPPHKGDKTRRLWLGCCNTEGKWQGVWKRWDRYGYQDMQCNFNDGYGICKRVVHGTLSRLGSICYKDGKQVECCRKEGLQLVEC